MDYLLTALVLLAGFIAIDFIGGKIISVYL